MSSPDTTIILPIYNEAGLVSTTVKRLMDFAEEHPEFQFLFVNDGSTDDTRATLEKVIGELNSPAIQFHSYDQNGGKGHAVREGMAMADTAYIGFTDADLAYDVPHLVELRKALQDHAVVIGSRSLGEDNAKNIRLVRRIMGKTFNVLARVILSLPYKDTQAGLKGFQRDAAKAIFPRMRMTGFSFDVEVIYLARILGHSVHEIPARVNEQHSDKSSKVKLVRDSLKMFLALVRVRKNHMAGHYK